MGMGLASSRYVEDWLREERSVAVLASGRRGNVISDIIDEPEVCLGCWAKGLDEGPRC